MQSGIPAVYGTPQKPDFSIMTASATGKINVNDWLAYSGQYVMAQFSGGAPGTAYWKTSGAGIAIESNPQYDSYGRIVTASALKYSTHGLFVVSAAFSGEPTLGLGVYPVSTGSGVAAPTGLSGVASTWQTAQVLWNSAMSGTANPQAAPVATLVGAQNFANAGTGELVIRLLPLAPDVRG